METYFAKFHREQAKTAAWDRVKQELEQQIRTELEGEDKDKLKDDLREELIKELRLRIKAELTRETSRALEPLPYVKGNVFSNSDIAMRMWSRRKDRPRAGKKQIAVSPVRKVLTTRTNITQQKRREGGAS